VTRFGGEIGGNVEQGRMDERALRWQERFEWPMVIAALLVIPWSSKGGVGVP